MSKLAEIRVAQDLITQAQLGDEVACARLYHAIAPAVYGLIRRLVGVRSVADDLFQQTLMLVFEKLDTFQGEAPLGAWLRRIAVSRCLMYLRSPWHRARLELGTRLDEPPDTEWPTATSSCADALDVERALASLAPTARAVVWLFEVEGYSRGEIAAAFGRSVSFSKSQLARAHRRLREQRQSLGARKPCTPIETRGRVAPDPAIADRLRALPAEDEPSGNWDELGPRVLRCHPGGRDEHPAMTVRTAARRCTAAGITCAVMLAAVGVVASRRPARVAEKTTSLATVSKLGGWLDAAGVLNRRVSRAGPRACACAAHRHLATGPLGGAAHRRHTVIERKMK